MRATYRFRVPATFTSGPHVATAACSVLFVLLHIAPLNLAPLAAAQEPERWGDELPPAPELSAMPVAPILDSVRWPAPPLHSPASPVRAIYVNAWAFGGRRF